jgi:hypothetical protein
MALRDISHARNDKVALVDSVAKLFCSGRPTFLTAAEAFAVSDARGPHQFG